MQRFCLALILALSGLSAAQAGGGPGYQLDCLPDGGGLSLAESVRMRLELHGWHEAPRPDFHVCLRLKQRQQIQYDGPGPMYGPYWGPPTYQVVEVPYLELGVTGRQGENWQGRQDLPEGDTPAQRIESGARLLIDRLPW